MFRIFPEAIKAVKGLQVAAAVISQGNDDDDGDDDDDDDNNNNNNNNFKIIQKIREHYTRKP
jgi:hypothetical protein